ncbi:MAG: hypothetical protein DRJ41_05010 [Thermoprotei archaeon]|nr:MAG: hypothetical protein DRJ41_05010 [Thermoprotei archaeon]
MNRELEEEIVSRLHLIPISADEKFLLAVYEYNKGNMSWRKVMSFCPYTQSCPLSSYKTTCPWGYHVYKRCLSVVNGLRRRKLRNWFRVRR